MGACAVHRFYRDVNVFAGAANRGDRRRRTGRNQALAGRTNAAHADRRAGKQTLVRSERLSVAEARPLFLKSSSDQSHTLSDKRNAMRKEFLFCCATLAILLLSPLSSAGLDQVEKPIYQDSDFWQFKVVDNGLPVRANAPIDGIYAVTFRRGRFTVNPGFPQMRSVMFPQDDENQFLRFPLFIGNTWRVRYSQVADRTTTATTSVKALEEVTTTAGTFRAFAIERSDKTYRIGGDSGRGDGRMVASTRYLYFYSPETRSVIKYSWYNSRTQQSREIALIKFAAARQETRKSSELESR